MTEVYTITVEPGQRERIHAYAPMPDYADTGKTRFGLILTDPSVLPEEVLNEAQQTRRGHVFMNGFRAPEVDHFLGWEHLEQELRRMAATNQSPDRIFDGCTVEISFSLHLLEPRPGSRYDTPMVVLPVSRVKIIRGPEPLA